MNILTLSLGSVCPKVNDLNDCKPIYYDPLADTGREDDKCLSMNMLAHFLWLDHPKGKTLVD